MTAATLRSDVNYSTANQMQFAIDRELLTKVNTMLPCKILAITGTNRYSVQLLINYLDSEKKPVTPPTIYSVPALTWSGGNAGVIIEYEVGDQVLVGFCQRDISIYKKTLAQSNPGSFRKFSIADGIIIAKITDTPPSIHVKITKDGIDIAAPDLPITASCKNLTANVTETAEIDAQTIKLGASAANSVLLQGVPITATITNVQGGTDTVTTTFTASAGGSSVVKGAL